MMPTGPCAGDVPEGHGRYSGESWVPCGEVRKAPRWMVPGAKSYAGSSCESSAIDGQRTRWRRGAVCCGAIAVMAVIAAGGVWVGAIAA